MSVCLDNRRNVYGGRQSWVLSGVKGSLLSLRDPLDEEAVQELPSPEMSLSLELGYGVPEDPVA